jgi:hypothetical protein
LNPDAGYGRIKFEVFFSSEPGYAFLLVKQNFTPAPAGLNAEGITALCRERMPIQDQLAFFCACFPDMQIIAEKIIQNSALDLAENGE